MKIDVKNAERLAIFQDTQHIKTSVGCVLMKWRFIIKMKIKEMIDYFKGVQAQHKGAIMAGMTNPNSETIIKTYDFVISKLQEWEELEEDYTMYCEDIRHGKEEPLSFFEWKEIDKEKHPE